MQATRHFLSIFALSFSVVQTTFVKLNANCSINEEQNLLAVLPGAGWDNLLNEERPLVVDRDQYNTCKVSKDRLYVIPDQMEIEPIKITSTSLTSEIFETNSEYVDSTSDKINLNTGLQFPAASISGSFSWEHKNVMRNQYNSKSVALRNQVRHRLYKVLLQPDPPLHKVFVNRLLGIAFLVDFPDVDIKFLQGMAQVNDYWLEQPGMPLEKNKENPISNISVTPFMKALKAAYLADLIVRDFGTHYVTESEIGAAIIQVSYVSEKVRNMTEESKNDISEGASLAFRMNLNLNLDFRGEHNNSKKQLDKFIKNVESRYQATHGGASYAMAKSSIDEWEKSVPENLVAIDRVGRPIYQAISVRSIPFLHPDLVEKVVEVVKSAVNRYYEANIVLGCLDPNSPLYDPNANTDSKTACDVSETSFLKNAQIFGGVFQICEGPSELCDIHGRKNPLTSDYSCPDGYQPVRFLPRQVIGCINSCSQSLFRKQCSEICAQVDAIWCSPILVNGTIRETYYFGGIYSDSVVNPVTGDKTCPASFYTFQIGKALKLCASVDREIGSLKAIPFGGLYACQSGNPMVNLIESYRKTLTRMNSINEMVFQSNFNGMLAPKRCPMGYVSYSAGLEDICQITYCIAAETFKKKRQRNIRSPPFIKLHTYINSETIRSDGVNPKIKGIDGIFFELKDDGTWKEKHSISKNYLLILFLTFLVISIILFALLMFTIFLNFKHKI